ncbi:MAG: AMP-binding protein, partial [Pseudomonadota bacterium]
MDLSATVPVAVQLPRQYNAATHFIDRHLDEGRANKLAFLDDQGEYTYSDLAKRVNQAAGMLLGLGLLPEQRVLLCLSDTIDFPVVFWGAVKAGLIPVPVSTMLSSSDYAYMLDDSRSRALIVSDHLLDHFADNLASRVFMDHVVVSGESCDGSQSLDALLAAKSNAFTPIDTTCDDNAFWLYTSGSTGVPKAAVHRHSDLVQTAELYGKGVLGLTEADRVFSAAKLFFAYGLGNAMSFPLHVGATAVLMSARPTPDAVLERLRESEASIFFGVPT